MSERRWLVPKQQKLLQMCDTLDFLQDASNKDDKNHGPQLDLNRNENKHNDVYNDNSTKFSVEEKYKTI